MRHASEKVHWRWMGGLYTLGILTALLLAGFTGWVVWSVGSVWLGGAR